MVVAGAHLNEGQSAGHERRLHPAGPGPVTELAEAVLAPAIGGADRTDAAGVPSAGTDLGEAHTPSHPRGDDPDIGRAVAELALAVRAPAVRGLSRRDSARVARPRAQLREGQAPWYRSGCVPVRKRAVADLPFADGGATGEGRPRGIRCERHRDRRSGARHRIPERVLERHTDGGLNRRLAFRGPGLGQERQLGHPRREKRGRKRRPNAGVAAAGLEQQRCDGRYRNGRPDRLSAPFRPSSLHHSHRSEPVLGGSVA